MYPFVHGTPASKRISIAGNIRRGKQRPELWREKRPDTRGCFTAKILFSHSFEIGQPIKQCWSYGPQLSTLFGRSTYVFSTEL